jgi:hypothetical protein
MVAKEVMNLTHFNKKIINISSNLNNLWLQNNNQVRLNSLLTSLVSVYKHP